MKNKFLVSTIILALLFVAIGPSSGMAAFAYSVTLTTAITYQNIGSATTTSLYIYLYENKDDTTPLPVQRPNLAKDASTSVGVGSLIGGSFNGTAVLSSDQPMAATLVQLPPGPAIEPLARNRPMSNGFVSGTQNVLLASVLKKYGGAQQITKFSVQNAGTTPTTVTFEFYGASASPVHSFTQTLQPGAGYPVDANTISQLANGFSGSAVLKTTGGSIVASALELDSTNYYDKAFEGVGQGATTVYMPSALCQFNAGSGVIQNTFYAIQNTHSSNSANITVTFDNANVVNINNLAPFNKSAVGGCDGGNTPGYSGSAVITSSQPIVVLGKVAGGGLSTAFIGASSGVAKIALPYVRYAANTQWFQGTMQRTAIAIQNVGGAPIAGVITVQYINPDGTPAGTHTIDTTLLPGGNLPVGGKVSSGPTAAGLSIFGCQNSCTTYGGGAIIEGPGGSQLAAIARLTSYVPASGARVGEDTSGIPYP